MWCVVGLVWLRWAAAGAKGLVKRPAAPGGAFSSAELPTNLGSFLRLCVVCVAGARRGSLRRCGSGERRV